MSNEVDAFLEHHGVRGMHWGIINEDPLLGRRKKKGKKLSPSEKYSDQLRRKYGPYTGQEEDDGSFRLTPLEKKLMLGAGGLILLGSAAYFGSKYLNTLDTKVLIDRPQALIDQYKKFADMPVEEFSKGLAANWEKGVELPKGSIVQRLSTIKETSIREKGFFAAFDPTDVERYKAELPKFWKQWGYKETSGYLVKLRANDPIKAPSGKESFDMFKELVSRKDIVERLSVGKMLPQDPVEKDKVIEGIAKQCFQQFSTQWANGYDSHPDVQDYFKLVKKHGYNALIDFNDSSVLAKIPMRFLDGKEFQIAGYEAVSEQAIKTAQATVKDLVMAAMNDVDAFLEHHGVRGQKWGIRREHPSIGSSHASIPVNTKPWSSYTAADYTVEQWHAASLIHNHSGPPTSKSACKLPVKTPNGIVNMHGVFAAAAALAGARGGVQASAEQKSKAAKALIRLYRQLGHKPPPSLMMHTDDNIDEFLSHHGVKGMKWGIRNERRLDRVSRVARGTATRAERARFALTETSTLSLLRNKGIQGAARDRQIELQDRKAAILSGHARLTDWLALHGGDRIFIPGNNLRKTQKYKDETPPEYVKQRREFGKEYSAALIQLEKDQKTMNYHDAVAKYVKKRDDIIQRHLLAAQKAGMRFNI